MNSETPDKELSSEEKLTKLIESKTSENDALKKLLSELNKHSNPSRNDGKNKKNK